MIEAEIREVGEQRVRVLEASTTLRNDIEAEALPEGKDFLSATLQLGTLIERDKLLQHRLRVLKGHLGDISGDAPVHRVGSYVITIAKISAAIYIGVALLAWLMGCSDSPFPWIYR